MDRSSVHQLAGVKHTLYHPRLPTLRRMEMDSMAHKLSDEHSRSSTPCDHRNFADARMTTYTHARQLLPSLAITDTGRRLTQRRTDSNATAQFLEWTPEKERTGMLAAEGSATCTAAPRHLQLTDLRRMDLGFGGHAVRFLYPKLTNSWRFCLDHNPSLDEYGQKPVPVETTNVFRTSGPAYR
ncbi:hypothetical protein GDO78_003288 [Eleutherodactylus coqui]|uniref:Uncharacterized protein n=1 Tax=Eleutherodactylus coqui TaxID=57060 RepID=A0A8J6ETY4_ELECQ|nr:hypothetical protein GDO78_003288 [Eleutherodactylus coqui]